MIRIVIAEGQRMLLDALAALLSRDSDFEIVGKASTGEEALKLIQRSQPDICITDIHLPGMKDLGLAERLKGSSCKVVILTEFIQVGYFERAIRAGVSAYVSKAYGSEELIQAIHSVMSGRRVYTKELIVGKESEANPLTEREKEVLILVATGKSTLEIAGELHLSKGTVRNYISGILEKLRVKNRIEAILRCKEKGWLESYLHSLPGVLHSKNEFYF
ncbi:MULTISPECIES: response regulator transcription factor [Paenibacillus]|uniref:response regulator transcription factor n=1 Tax=Paenibacillus TaxID=44249 RepID=UPI0022B893AC|nr:response regulator transcription factor [Paenibacillus caseinilyticus]MCZ8523080.1 response regulator transcription factor [Paenibacillus caseinilyticus]